MTKKQIDSRLLKLALKAKKLNFKRDNLQKDIDILDKELSEIYFEQQNIANKFNKVNIFNRPTECTDIIHIVDDEQFVSTFCPNTAEGTTMKISIDDYINKIVTPLVY